uniref:Eukaryotic translation initiation factor 3 subunit L n=1 Tax=Compsopogon caeruleus TaxID=31354 RepID=A0A7S1XB54_9RHOD|mmetsp:Transcript_11015/g.21979  ORF Transcript_11015/g.21979 Transcript_11015/m.21979 type:complete len:582 (+) Transcript_11015:97-1842(+)
MDSDNWRRAPTFLDELDDAERAGSGYDDVPDVVRQFLRYFRTKFRELGKTEAAQRIIAKDIHSLYEDTFSKITERFYKGGMWPDADTVAPLVDHDALFLVFYRELCYRQIYASSIQPTLDQRVGAWENYCDLFNAFLNDELFDVCLPASWLWDAVDEFVYQFEAWCNYRSKLKNKDEDDIAFLRDNGHIWNVNTVLQYLHVLVNKSSICPWLLNGSQPTGSNDIDSEDFDPSWIPAYRYVGYFSVIGLLRIHCLLGDYRLALMVLQPMDFDEDKPLYTEVTAAHVALFYYMGFAYIMLRRYEDAVRVLSMTLQHIGRIKQYHTRSYQYEQINKRNDQMLALLAICVAFCPQHEGDSVESLLNEKYSDRLFKLRQGDEQVFEELFSYSAPKFISPSPPDYAVPTDTNYDASRFQLALFKNEVRQQIVLPEIRSYLRLYMTVSGKKLASFMDIEESTFRSHLFALKHKSWSFRGQPSLPPLEGTFGSTEDVGFYVDLDMLQIQDTKVDVRYGEYFINGISKLDEIARAIKNKAYVPIRGVSDGSGRTGPGRGGGGGPGRGRGNATRGRGRGHFRPHPVPGRSY